MSVRVHMQPALATATTHATANSNTAKRIQKLKKIKENQKGKEMISHGLLIPI